MPAPGYHQGANAVVQVGTRTRGELVASISCLTKRLNGIFKTKPRGFFATGANIVRRETPLALYKGLGAVLSGIVPKMAIRFASFEAYKGWLADKETGKTSLGNIFIGALAIQILHKPSVDG